MTLTGVRLHSPPIFFGAPAMKSTHFLFLWTGALAASGGFAWTRAMLARSALKGLSGRDAVRAVVGIRSEALDARQRRAVQIFRASFLLFLLTLYIPPIAMRFHLSQQVEAAARSEGIHQRTGSDPTQILRSGRLVPVRLVDGQYGVRVDRLVPEGALERLGFRSGDTILSIDGRPLRIHEAALGAIAALSEGRVKSVQVKSYDGEARTIAIFGQM